MDQKRLMASGSQVIDNNTPLLEFFRTIQALYVLVDEVLKRVSMVNRTSRFPVNPIQSTSLVWFSEL